MDIKLPLDVSLPLAAKSTTNALNLKLNQVLDARVIDTQIMLDTLTLKVADKPILVQAQQPLNLESGQPLRLQVVKLLPAVEFKILPATSPVPPQPAETLSTEAPILKLLSISAPIPATGKPSLNRLSTGQQLQAVIVDIKGNKLTLQLSPSPPDTSRSRPLPSLTASQGPLTVTVDSRQLLFANGKTDASPSLVKTPPPSSNPLTPGAQINLQVVKPGDTPTFAVSLPVADTEQKIVALFKQLLPIQSTSAPLLDHLTQILPALENNPTIAETLKQLAQEILRAIPLKTQLTEASRLKQSVDHSGLFLESKLAELLSGKDGASLQQDLKLKLLKFVQLLTLETEAQVEQKLALDSGKLLQEALQKTHSALAKLTLDQFQSLPRDDAPKLGWVLDLPFFNDNRADSAHIEIELDKQAHQDSDKKNWAVSITITPPDLATIHCRISCYDGAVNTRFWSEAAETVEKINTHLDYLKQQFEQKGLKTGFMEAHQGKATRIDSQNTSLTNLLSEKA